MISANKAKLLLKELLATRVVGQEVSYTEAPPELLEFIFNLPRFARHKGGKLKVLMASCFGSRKTKALHICSENSNFFIPIFASQLKSNKSKSKKITRAAVLAAMREAIRYQIDEYRAAQKARRASCARNSITYKSLMFCPVSGKRLTARSHVDHYGKPFIQLADDWLGLNGFTKYTEVPLKRGKLDGELLKSWQDYHKQHARLRLLSAAANISKGAGDYKSKFKQ